MKFNIGEKVLIKKEACANKNCYVFPCGCQGIIRTIITLPNYGYVGKIAISMEDPMNSWCAFTEDCLAKLDNTQETEE